LSDQESGRQMPAWLREFGMAGWYGLGALAIVVVICVIFAVFAQITVPLIFAAIIGAVFSPWVDWLVRHKVKRAVSALLVLFLIVVVAGALGFLVVYGVVNQWPAIKSQAQAGLHSIQKQIDKNTTQQQSQQLEKDVQQGVQSAAKGLVGHIPQIIGGIAGLAFTLFIMANIIFFMLKDGGPIGDWVARQARGLRGGERLSRRLLRQSGEAMRRYILGVAVVAIFNAVVVGIGAWALGVPLALVIAIVTFAFAFIPYLGAIIAGAFAVIMAISTGPTAAVIMLLIVIVANGGLQTVVNQFAMKHALALHPLVVLIVTLLGGVIAGAFGAFLAAPVTAIVINATAELAQAGRADDLAPSLAAETPAPPGDAAEDAAARGDEAGPMDDAVPLPSGEGG
jgi:putative heme transporter